MKIITNPQLAIMDKLRSMEIFVAVVDAGNFTAAASQFNLSPVMVGKHIAELESTLGARLLTRTTRRQSLTEIGAQYVEQCRAILAQIAIAESGAEAMRSRPRGRLKITAPVSFGTEWVSPAITDYLRLHPDVSVDLSLSDRMVDMVEEGYDVAIRIGKQEDSTMIARPLFNYEMVVCATPAYLKQHGTPRTPEDLAGTSAWISWSARSGSAGACKGRKASTPSRPAASAPTTARPCAWPRCADSAS
jgi:DNA-binding transcriptional LysR family regulator